MAQYVDLHGLEHFWKRVSEIINKRINDAVTKGLHACEGCGAPYKGKPHCEYCGRGFFVDFSMYKVNTNEQTNPGRTETTG